jgi:hypothetical protein
LLHTPLHPCSLSWSSIEWIDESWSRTNCFIRSEGWIAWCRESENQKIVSTGRRKIMLQSTSHLENAPVAGRNGRDEGGGLFGVGGEGLEPAVAMMAVLLQL